MAFCGGCKSEIDRKALFEAVKQHLSGYDFQFTIDDNQIYCCALIINGCPTECRTRDFGKFAPLVSVRGEMIGDKAVKEHDLAQKVIELIKEHEKQDEGVLE